MQTRKIINLKELTRDQELDLSSQSISASQVKEIVEYVKKHKIKSLNLENNNIGDEGCELLKNCNSLTNLNVTANNIGPEGAAQLSLMASLEILDISHNSIEDEGAVALSKSKSLNQIDVTFCEIGEIGIIGLMANKFIEKLFVEGKDIGELSLKAIFENDGLLSLSLRGKALDPDSIQLLNKNESLTDINLSWNLNKLNEKEIKGSIARNKDQAKAFLAKQGDLINSFFVNPHSSIVKEYVGQRVYKNAEDMESSIANKL